MRSLARTGAKARNIQELIAFADGLSTKDALMQLDRAIRGVFRYRDENIELIRTPEHMMNDWNIRGYLEGDCDDISTFVGSVLAALGIHARFVAIRANPDDPEYKHVFVGAQTDGTWIRMDATVSNATRMMYYGERMVQTI